jgi:hypothetical protein
VLNLLRVETLLAGLDLLAGRVHGGRHGK